NKGGYESFEQVMNNGMKPIAPQHFESVVAQTGALVLDTRSAADFHQGFVPNSVNIGLKGDFAPWVGAMIVDVKQPIALVCEPGTVEEAITRLSRVGFDKVIGYLEGGFERWKAEGMETDSVNRITPEEFAQRYSDDAKVIDVRKETE